MLDKLFYEKFKWKVRSEGVFSFVSEDLVYQYGVPYIIFPKNGFKYVYNIDIDDLFNEIDSWYLKNKSEITYKNLVNEYTDKNLINVLKNKNLIEITIKCDDYYSLLCTNENISILKEFLKTTKI